MKDKIKVEIYFKLLKNNSIMGNYFSDEFLKKLCYKMGEY